MVRRLGLETQVLVPHNTVATRIAGIESEDAHVRVIDGGYDEAVTLSATLALELLSGDLTRLGRDTTPCHAG
jgi:threonine dehydratase